MGSCLAPKPNTLDTTQICLMGQLLQLLIKPDFVKAKPDVILAQGTCGQLGLDLETEQRKALAMNGDVLAWPERGVSSVTPTWAGAGHRRLSMVPRNACSYRRGISPALLPVFVSREGSLSSFLQAFKTGSLNPKVD